MKRFIRNNILIILILLIALLMFIPYCASAQTNINRTIIRGDATTLTYKYPGDISADSISFVVKADRLTSSPRLIQKNTDDGITASYSAPYTTVTIALNTTDTQGLTLAQYVYDIMYASDTDTATIFTGYFNLQLDVQTPADGVATTTKYYTVALDTPATSPAFLIGQDSDNSWKPVSKDSMQKALGVDSLHALSIMANAVVSGQEYIIDYSYRSYKIDSVFAVVGDSAISFNIGYADNAYGVTTCIFNSDQTESNTTTGTWYTSIDTPTIPADKFVAIFLSVAGIVNESIYLKIFWSLK